MTLILKPNYKYIWAAGGYVVEPSDLKKQQGWTSEVPPFQYENWIQNRQDQYLAHINQRGIPAWDGQTEYEAGGLSYVQGSDGKVYKSVAASGPSTTVQDPITDATDTYWTIAFADMGAFLTPTEGDVRYVQRSNNLSDLTNPSAARTNLGVVPASTTQAGLVELATDSEAAEGTSTTLAVTPAAAQAAGDSRYLQILNNGSDVDDAATFRTNLGIVQATEAVSGLVELATAAETLSGVSTTRAIHPAAASATYAKKFIFNAREERPSGTGAGNNLNGLNVRQLNTVVGNTIPGASLSSNQITLPAGTYRIRASAPFSNGDQHRLKLYNVTDSSVAILGTSENAGGAFTTRSFVSGRITIASPKVFELQHYMPTVYTDGLGLPVNDGSNEVYAEITVETE